MRQWALVINSIKPPILPNLAATSKRQIGLVNRLSHQGLFGCGSYHLFNQLGNQISVQRIVQVSSIDAERTSVHPIFGATYGLTFVRLRFTNRTCGPQQTKDIG